MKGDDIIQLLGRTSDDDKIKTFLASCGITKQPKLKPGDLDTHLGKKNLGLEIVFRDERYLDVESDEYEEGALVLWNVAMYGDDENFDCFGGQLPLGLTFDLGLKEVQGMLGKKPAWKDSADARWDFEGYCVFVTFDKQFNKMRNLAIQLPLE